MSVVSNLKVVSLFCLLCLFAAIIKLSFHFNMSFLSISGTYKIRYLDRVNLPINPKMPNMKPAIIQLFAFEIL